MILEILLSKKWTRKIIALPLTITFNEWFSAGIVPENLKITKVIPIYKKKKTMLKNFQTIDQYTSMFFKDTWTIGIQ